jgi:nucleotidyltransferase/DNA polymerase involved in DNA repair
MKSARDVGVSGRLAEVKIRYTGFETHTHGRSIPVSMDDEEVFTSLAEKLFANNVQSGRKIRLIGFRLGHLDTPRTKQTRLLALLEEE